MTRFSTDVTWKIQLDWNGDAKHEVLIKLNNPVGQLKSSMLMLELPRTGVFGEFSISLHNADLSLVTCPSDTFQPGFLQERRQLQISLDTLQKNVEPLLRDGRATEALQLRLGFTQPNALTQCGTRFIFLLPIKTRLHADSVDLRVCLPSLSWVQWGLLWVIRRLRRQTGEQITGLPIHTLVVTPRMEGRVVRYSFADSPLHYLPLAFCYRDDRVSLKSLALAAVTFFIGAFVLFIAVVNDLWGLAELVQQLQG